MILGPAFPLLQTLSGCQRSWALSLWFVASCCGGSKHSAGFWPNSKAGKGQSLCLQCRLSFPGCAARSAHGHAKKFRDCVSPICNWLLCWKTRGSCYPWITSWVKDITTWPVKERATGFLGFLQALYDFCCKWGFCEALWRPSGLRMKSQRNLTVCF